MRINRLAVLATAALVAGCSLDKQAAPALTGPSELGVSLTITASPDQLPEDGSSTSTITVIARDANSMPVSGLTLAGVLLAEDPAHPEQGYLPTNVRGTLSSSTISTDGTGKATTTFTAPIMSPNDTTTIPMKVQFTPVGSNAANDVPQTANFSLTLPTVITLQGPVARFTFSTGANGTHFDGSGSTAVAGRSIVNWDWDFGDGTPHGSGVIVDHAYAQPGVYVVTLRVTDSVGQVGLLTQQIKF